MAPAPRTVLVEVRPPYPVRIGVGLLDAVLLDPAPSAVALVSDDTVAPLYAERVTAPLTEAGVRVVRYVVPAGEASKSLEVWGDLLRRMVRDGFDRRAAVLALGGGVVGDLAGFVAASFLRGVRFYGLPTSLLAMVDASVGGKTAVNLPEGKNLVGAFWQPRAVLADVSVLRSLPERVFRQGAVEHVKHGLLADPGLLDGVFAPSFAPAGDPEDLADAVARSVAIKAAVVAGDEREAGSRAFLNLGHTLAHGLEAVTDHALSHGDAVAYGLHFAARLAANRGHADASDATLRLLTWLGPAPLPDVPFEAVEPFMLRDKKVVAGRKRYVLLDAPGRPILVDDVGGDEERRAWRELREATLEARA